MKEKSPEIESLSPEILNFALESSINAVAFADLEGRLSYVNESFLRLWNYEHKQDVLNQSVLDFWQDPQEAYKVVQALQQTGEWQGELVGKKSNGQLFHTQLSAHMVKNNHEQPVALMASFQDITEQKKVQKNLQESREMFRAIAMTAQDAIILINQQGKVQFWNPAAEKILGYTYKDMMGQDLHGIIMPERYRQRFEAGFSRFQQTGTGDRINTTTKLFAQKKCGSEIPIELSLSRFHIQGEIWAAGIIRDVSNQQKFEQDLIQAKELAEAANKAKSDFLANMSHEIRTPLNGVIGFLDLLMETRLQETQKQYLDTAKSSAYALLDIISDILDFSKIEAGKLELNIEKTDLIEIIEQTADIVKHKAHEKGLEFLLKIDANLPRYVQADQIRLRQVLVNLLSNAVKFTEHGEIELNVEFAKEEKTENHAKDNTRQKQTDQNNYWFIFSVRDTGIGIKDQDQKLIFDSFSQVESSSIRKYGGTGLGLAISNSLLSKMGSHLELRSEYGQGSRFFFQVSLPVEDNQTLVPDEPINIAKALIVDDNENNRIIIQEMLKLRKIASDQAGSGEDALALYEKYHDYDVVIVDYHMPYMDGLEVIEKIRQMNKSASDHAKNLPGLKRIGGKQPIVFLHSSSDDSLILEECQRLNVQSVMIKPVKMRQLFKNLADLSQRIADQEKSEESETPQTQNTIETKNNELSDTAYKVLIAEDNNVNMTLASLIISKILPQAIIYKAYNGAEAWQLFQEEKPDIIFMDIQMPEMNGYEVTKHIRSQEKSIPIIALTAGTVKGERERCLSVGMDDYVSKPFALQTIREKVDAWLVNPKKS